MAKKSPDDPESAARDSAAMRRERLLRQSEEIANLRRDLAQRNPAPESAVADAEFSRAAVHELRSQLGVIAGYAEILLAGASPALTDEHRALLDSIKSASAAMLRLVDDLYGD